MSGIRTLARDGDVLSGAALAGLGAYILTTALSWPYMSTNGPGPGFFPVWYGIIIIVLSLALIGSRLMKAVPASGAPADWPGIIRALSTWMAFVVSAALMPYVGFATALALLCLFLILVVFQRRVVEAVIASIAIPALFHIIFTVLLQVELPLGPLGI